MTVLKERILGFDQQVPRYTSYPTAPHFKEGFSSEAYTQWLSALPKQETLSLYVHVPFCANMCWYCGCHTKVSKQYKPAKEYTLLLQKEIALLNTHLSNTQSVRHLHFGGGSPTFLKPADFEMLMDCLQTTFSFAPDAEQAIEIDPRTLTTDHIDSYARTGITRVSLGVQDTNEKVLKAVNREQDFSLSFDAVQTFRQKGINRINIDLMYGLPYQTLTLMANTIEQSLRLQPDRISLFGYAHVPWMKKHMRLIDENALPDKSLRYDLFEFSAEQLQQNGYVPIGIDHFVREDDPMAKAAKTGKLQRNFQGYTTDTAKTLIGLGVSSIGTLPQGYVQNFRGMAPYKEALEQGKLPVEKSCNISQEDLLRGDIIERLMCDFVVNVPFICQKHGYDETYLNKDLLSLKALEKEGFLTLSETGIVTMNKDARQMVRVACAAFDPYFQEIKKRHATAI